MKADASTLLLVDGNRTRLRELAEVLSISGYSVKPVRSGGLALAELAAHAPDLILLSVRLPDISGFEALRLFRANRNTSHIPVILASENLSVDERVRGLAMGAVDLVDAGVSHEE